MNDLVAPEEVERRLQRTLARRADDMAAGDGAGWQPAGVVSPFADRSTGSRRPSTRLLAAAAIATAIGVAAIGLQMGRNESGPVVAANGAGTRVTRPPTGPSTAPPSTAPPSTAPPSTAPPTSVSPSGRIETPVGSFVRVADGVVVGLTWWPEVALGWDRRAGSHDLRAGEHPANYWEGVDQRASSLSLFFPDGVLYLDGDRVGLRDDLVAFAEGLRRVPDTTEFEITPPPGYAPG